MKGSRINKSGTVKIHSTLNKLTIIEMLKSKYTVLDSPTLSHDITLPNGIFVDIIDSASIQSDADFSLLLQRRKFLQKTEKVVMFCTFSTSTTIVQQLQKAINPTSNFRFVPIINDEYIIGSSILILGSNENKTKQCNERSDVKKEVMEIVEFISAQCGVDLLKIMKENKFCIADLLDSNKLESSGLKNEEIQKIHQFLSLNQMIV
ncbi:Uncharacterized protein QTN25_008711 [Entamoeba marina]